MDVNNQPSALAAALGGNATAPEPQAPSLETAMAGQEAQQPPVSQPADLPRFRRTVGNTLKAALLGFALDGIPGAVAGAVSPTGVQAAATRAKTFADAQAASAVADATLKSNQLAALPQELQDRHDAEVASQVKSYSDIYGPPLVVPNTSAGASTAMGELAAQNADGIPHHMIVVGRHNVFLWNSQQVAKSDKTVPQLHKWGKMGDANLRGMTQEQWTSLKPPQQNFYLSRLNELSSPIVPAHDSRGMAIQQQVLQQRIATVKALPGSDPDREPLLKKLESDKQLLDSAVTAANTATTQEEVRKAKAKQGVEEGGSDFQSLVDGVGNYTLDPSKVSSLRTGQRERLLAAVKQKYPDFSMAEYNNRFRVSQDFASGKVSDQITSLQTFAGHTKDASDLVDGLRNTSVPLVNTPVNKLRTQLGNDKINAFQQALEAVKDEYLNFLKAGHAPMEQELRRADEIVNENKSPAQLQAIMKQMAHTVLIRARSLNDRYYRTFGKNYDQLLSPEATADLQHLGLDTSTVFGQRSKAGSSDPFAQFGGKQR